MRKWIRAWFSAHSASTTNSSSCSRTVSRPPLLLSRTLLLLLPEIEEKWSRSGGRSSSPWTCCRVRRRRVFEQVWANTSINPLPLLFVFPSSQQPSPSLLSSQVSLAETSHCTNTNSSTLVKVSRQSNSISSNIPEKGTFPTHFNRLSCEPCERTRCTNPGEVPYIVMSVSFGHS